MSHKYEPINEPRRPIPSSSRSYIPSGEDSDEDVPDFGSDILEAPPSLIIEMNPFEPTFDSPIEQPISTELKRTSHSERLKNVVEPYEFRWDRAGNLDHFIIKVYQYYEGKGMYCILLSSILNILTMSFVVGFILFIGGCLDYTKFVPGKTLTDAVIPNWLHTFSKSLFILFLIFLAWQTIKLIYDTRDLLEMFHFYTKVLGIPDEDMQSIEWREVVKRIGRLPPPKPRASSRDQTPIRLDPYRISHQIMRRDNYLIALFNQNRIDLTIELPGFVGPMKYLPGLTGGLEWSLSYCIESTFFDVRGKLRRGVLKREERAIWASKLRRKFQFMGLISFLFGPILVAYTLCYIFFRYFEEYYKNPKAMSARQYTLLAKWKLREFNELPHYFRNRINSSYTTANEYLDLFPREKTNMLMRFVAFIAGSIAGAIAILAFFDSELVLQFELFAGRSVLAVGTALGLIIAATRGSLPDTQKVVDPEILLTKLLDHLHYMPRAWHERLHSEKVRQQFSTMFTLKVVQLVEEVFGLIITPILLFFTLPNSCYEVVDLFRECSAKEPGLGYVCSFASFNLKQHGDEKYGTPKNVFEQGKHRPFVAQDGKLEKSLIAFKEQNPDWLPEDPASSIYLSKVQQFGIQALTTRRTQLNDILSPNEAASLDSDQVLSNEPSGLIAKDAPMGESLYTRSSLQDEPISSNPFNKGIMMRVLNMMFETHRNS